MRTIFRLAACLALALLCVPAARADVVSDLKAQLQQMQQQMETLKKQLDQVQQQQQQQQQQIQANKAQPQQPAAAAPAGALSIVPQQKGVVTDGKTEHRFLERKPGDTFTLYTPGGEAQIYGNLDVSFDVTTKGIENKTAPDHPNSSTPTGRNGWMPAISTNLSYIGIRGFQDLGDSLPFNFVYQLETQIDIAATSGTAETNSNKSNAVKGGLTSRNSFIGLSNNDWGALKIGKTDAPYKSSTSRLNPFSGMLGDYQVIMSNTGGDNRVEFGTRLDHSLWYESPDIFRDFRVAVLWSPGQNRASNSDNIAAGESDCTGGNIPGSGGTGSQALMVPVTCNDGSFSDAVSASVTYQNGPFFATTAYERHFKVNRNSDIIGSPLQPQDVADEDAWKFGAQYTFPTRTTVGGIVERMNRYVPSVLAFQNERQRWGTWLVLSQQFDDQFSGHFGWAHAFKTPGDPGQHNTGSTAGAGVDNSANMFTVAVKYLLGKNLTWYADWAMTVNGPFAHYDLGAGGRAVTTDCHDAAGSVDNPNTSGGESGTPQCWAGGRLMGVSTGLKWTF